MARLAAGGGILCRHTQPSYYRLNVVFAVQCRVMLKPLLRPCPTGGAYSAPPNLAGFGLGKRRGRGGRGKWRGGKGKGGKVDRGKGRVPKLLLNQGPSETCYATAWAPTWGGEGRGILCRLAPSLLSLAFGEPLLFKCCVCGAVWSDAEALPTSATDDIHQGTERRQPSCATPCGRRPGTAGDHPHSG